MTFDSKNFFAFSLRSALLECCFEGLGPKVREFRFELSAAAVRARTAKPRNPAGLFSAIVRRNLWHFITCEQEEVARRGLLKARELNWKRFCSPYCTNEHLFCEVFCQTARDGLTSVSTRLPDSFGFVQRINCSTRILLLLLRWRTLFSVIGPRLSDKQLLQEYASTRSEAAFTNLVSRHINLVYSVALRHVLNHQHAEDVAQAVFIILARKAEKLAENISISGWLYQTARLTAANFLRTELRRIEREEKAQMESILNKPADDSELSAEVTPLVDDALAALSETDREVLLLRFFNALSFEEVGASLGTTASAAKMKVSRALAKLRKRLCKRGVVMSIASLTACISLSLESLQGAPAGLAATVTASALKGSAASAPVGALVKGTLKLMALTKVKTAAAIIAGLLLATGTATMTLNSITLRGGYEWQAHPVNSEALNALPAEVKIVPTKFPQFAGWVVNDGKVLAIAQTPLEMLTIGYGLVSPYRVTCSAKLPSGRFDFIATLPQGSFTALHDEITRRWRLNARSHSRATRVLQLTVRVAGAGGLQQTKTTSSSSESLAGRLSCSNQPMSYLAAMLERIFELPVVDHTGLRGNFDLDLLWDESDYRHHNTEALKKALLEQLGLGLDPATESVDMLVVEPAK